MLSAKNIAFAVVALLAAAPIFAEGPVPSTFSIVATDPENGEVGVAVASRFFAVGTGIAVGYLSLKPPEGATDG